MNAGFTYNLPLYLFDDTAAELERMIWRLTIDDVLARRGWRLEYVRLLAGATHYRLYRICRARVKLVGIVDVMAYQRGLEVDRKMAVYLAGIGFTPANTRILIGAAQTPLEASKQRLPRLFYAPSNDGESRDLLWA